MIETETNFGIPDKTVIINEKIQSPWKQSSYYQCKNMMILPVETAARLAQSVEHETLNLGVVGSSPTLGDLYFRFCLILAQIKRTINIPTYNSLYCIHIVVLKIAHQCLFEISHPRIGNKINKSWNAYIPLENVSKIIYLPNNLQFNREIIVNKNLRSNQENKTLIDLFHQTCFR